MLGSGQRGDFAQGGQIEFLIGEAHDVVAHPASGGADGHGVDLDSQCLRVFGGFERGNFSRIAGSVGGEDDDLALRIAGFQADGGGGKRGADGGARFGDRSHFTLAGQPESVQRVFQPLMIQGDRAGVARPPGEGDQADPVFGATVDEILDHFLGHINSLDLPALILEIGDFHRE